jgi:hypothetical protein
LRESSDLSHRETQMSLPGPLDEVSFGNKVGTMALPAVALSIASAFVFVVTLLYLRLSGELSSLFVLPLGWGRAIAVLSAVLAWLVVVWCGRRPGLLGPRVWALLLAVLNSVLALLLFALPTETWVNALTVAGFAATLTLLPRLYKLRPDSAMIPRIAPLAFFAVLLPVLVTVYRLGGAIAASKQVRVDQTIARLGEWTSEVEAIAKRDWSGATWDDSAKVVDQLEEIRPAAQLDLSLWREASILEERDKKVAAQAGKLLTATAAGLARENVPHISQLDEPLAYNDGTHWEKSAIFPKASATVGHYFEQMGRIFSELNVQDSFPESQGLSKLKQLYLEEKPKLAERLKGQMDDWTDQWAIFRIPPQANLLSQSEVPLAKLLRNPSPLQGKPAANLPWFLEQTYERAKLWTLRGCRSLEYTEIDKKNKIDKYEYYRIDCYSYSPLAKEKEMGADLRVEMRLVYRSDLNKPLRSTELPFEVYFLFPLPDGQKEADFRQQVMSDLAEAVRETTGLQVKKNRRSGMWGDGFNIPGKGKHVVVYRPGFDSWIDGRTGLVVQAMRVP